MARTYVAIAGKAGAAGLRNEQKVARVVSDLIDSGADVNAGTNTSGPYVHLVRVPCTHLLMLVGVAPSRPKHALSDSIARRTESAASNTLPPRC